VAWVVPAIMSAIVEVYTSFGVAFQRLDHCHVLHSHHLSDLAVRKFFLEAQMKKSFNVQRFDLLVHPFPLLLLFQLPFLRRRVFARRKLPVERFNVVVQSHALFSQHLIHLFLFSAGHHR
jgi:hypothetical protein